MFFCNQKGLFNGVVEDCVYFWEPKVPKTRGFRFPRTPETASQGVEKKEHFLYNQDSFVFSNFQSLYRRLKGDTQSPTRLKSLTSRGR